ncbi:hypothetical protein GCM10010211_28640 [Streptomyces albospinus]|uniref:Uncharacterized protein n=1 Tax=Streptomyces albospinus TaxID=285515 RepID=A0ABQ2UZM2_9ACTN|nr:hypothetical protein [Streptomyces albospinus]GGU61885.1 hypothetical protein GCM10010211_28640 [Streptomyces albospinus]
MTVSRPRPWFLPASLVALLAEALPDRPADTPSDPAPAPEADAGPAAVHEPRAAEPPAGARPES